jgi:hypothetical protein
VIFFADVMVDQSTMIVLVLVWGVVDKYEKSSSWQVEERREVAATAELLCSFCRNHFQ